ncbi:protein TIF31 [Clonorchis sinensis]|uniref:Protein TIF31 n=1 Tax=Clonorchis sinensis TaxID=79923 RepID=G7YDL2_CLOSI|nr:protein TIF31 [Clonorchis sinensis]
MTELNEEAQNSGSSLSNAAVTTDVRDGVSDKQDPETIEDVPFTIKIIPSHSEPFELQVSSFELVQEIHRVLMDREETCNCTCFSLVLNGQTLDMFAELKSVEGLNDGAEIRVVEGNQPLVLTCCLERYSVREAKNHVRHVHDLLYSVEPCDAYAGREQMSLTFVNTITGDLDRKSVQSRIDSRMEFTPPEHILPGFCNNGPHDLPLCPLHPLEHEGKPIRCVRQLNYSNWNPPPPPRRLLGDLIYIFFHTLEDKRYHITACPRGFFVNMSTENEFNPHPTPHAYVAHSLVDLLKQLSPGFKRNFEALLKRRASKHPFERVPSPYQIHSWLAPSFEHTPDSVRKEEAFSSRMACEENLPGQTRDWNEELQVTHELPQERLTERLLRDRAIFKSNSDFVAAATRAAMSVVNGDIMAINPGETRKQQMFIWNNMFFSLGFDVKDHYKHFGGEHAAYVATSSDLSGVRTYSMLDQAGLHTLGTAIIDYRGFRVTAQTIIPGILEKEQEQLVVYGSIDFGKTVLTDKRYEDLLSKTAKQLKIRPHKVVNQNGDVIQLYSSIDCKGIVGNDRRTYILDLLRTFPPDLNYFGSCPTELRPELPASLTALGYPYNHRHLLSTLRQELIEAFFEFRHETFLRLAAFEIQKMKAEKAKTLPSMANGTKESEEETLAADNPVCPPVHFVREDSPKIDPQAAGDPSHSVASVVTAKKPTSSGTQSDDLILMKKLLDTGSNGELEDLTQQAIQRAAKAVGSACPDRFELAFNPDVCQQFVTFCDSELEALEADKALICDACDFLVNKQIPGFVKDCLNLYVTPQDSRALVEILHQRGINVRYLNRLIELVERKPSLGYLKRLCVIEVLIRSAKHVFKNYIQEVDPMLLSVGVAHFLNCFLTSCPNLTPLAGIDEQVLRLSRNKKGKKKPKNLRESPGKPNMWSYLPLFLLFLEEMAWANETSASLWAELVKEAKEYYHYNINAADIDAFSTHYEIHRVQLLRAFCPTVGIQLLLRDYPLTPSNGAKHHTKPVFVTEDILSLYPIVKHLHPHATDAYHYFTTGQARISTGHLQEGFELINEALSLLNSVYGPLHPDIGACNRLLARLSYVMGEHQAALLFQHRATMVSERVHGIDNPNTTTEYVHFALYSFACGHIGPALQLLYRARYIALMCHGEIHPEMIQIDTNIGLMLQMVGELDLALVFLENALSLSRTFYGEKNLKEAFTCHLISRAYTYRGDFRAALDYEKRRFAIYKDRLGPDNDYTRDSDECLRHLTQQAVTRARRVAELAASSVPKLTNTGDPKTLGPQVTDADGVSGISSAYPLRTLMPTTLSSYGVTLPVPTVTSTLETLNRVNGILVLQLRTQETEQTTESQSTDDTRARIKLSADCELISEDKLSGQCLGVVDSDNVLPDVTAALSVA